MVNKGNINQIDPHPVPDALRVMDPVPPASINQDPRTEFGI
jgi:hypothetical protein